VDLVRADHDSESVIDLARNPAAMLCSMVELDDGVVGRRHHRRGPARLDRVPPGGDYRPLHLPGGAAVETPVVSVQVDDVGVTDSDETRGHWVDSRDARNSS